MAADSELQKHAIEELTEANKTLQNNSNLQQTSEDSSKIT